MKDPVAGHDPAVQQAILASVLAEHPELNPSRIARQIGLNKSYLNSHQRGVRGRKPLRLDIALRLDRFFATIGVDKSRRDAFWTAALGDAIAAEFQDTRPKPRDAATAQSLSADRAFGDAGLLTSTELLHEAAKLADHGQWLASEQAALRAVSMMKAGSDEWAITILEYLVSAQQQAGNIRGAERYIGQVIAAFQADPGSSTTLSPPVASLLADRQGWILTEQYGRYPAALDAFAAAYAAAREGDTRDVLTDSLHFRGRILSEIAMTAGGAWFAARVDNRYKTVDRKVLMELERLLHDSLWQELARDGSPYHIQREFIIKALIRPGEARKVLANHAAVFREDHCAHLLALSNARWAVSEEEWDSAVGFAGKGFEGYCRVRFPQGIALSAAISSVALWGRGLTTKRETFDCLDGWIVALALHWYPEHPLWKRAADGLRYTCRHLKREEPRWMQEYVGTLRVRYSTNAGMFRAFGALDPVFADIAVQPVNEIAPFLEKLLGVVIP